MVNKGDTIEMTGLMSNDPDPIPVGARGVVTGVYNQDTPYEQYGVRWEGIGRSLMVLPEDPFKVIASA